MLQRALPLAAAVLAGVLGLLDFTERIELQTYDLRVQATAQPSTPSNDILLIAIDNESLRRMEPLVGRWPWPRLVHATVIDYLAAAGARVIGYDVLFAERDLRTFNVGDTEWTGEESDAALVESTKKAGNVVHAAEASSVELVDPTRAMKENFDAPALNVLLPPTDCVEPRPRLTPPFPALAAASKGIGHTLLPLDANGAVRRLPPFVQVGERVFPSMSAAMVMAAGMKPVLAPRIDETQHCNVMIPWRGPAENASGQPTFASFSFYDVFYAEQQLLEGQKPAIDPAQFKNRIVIVGATAEGLNEAFTTSFARGEINGPEVHANMVDALLAHRMLTRAPLWVTTAWVVAAVATVGVAGAFLNAWLTGLVSALFAAMLVWQSLRLFANGTWIAVVVPLFALVLAYVGDLAWKYFVEGREKRQVKKLFSRPSTKYFHARSPT